MADMGTPMSNVQCAKVNKRGLLKFGFRGGIKSGGRPLSDLELIVVFAEKLIERLSSSIERCRIIISQVRKGACPRSC
jgi:hypothetical protein